VLAASQGSLIGPLQLSLFSLDDTCTVTGLASCSEQSAESQVATPSPSVPPIAPPTTTKQRSAVEPVNYDAKIGSCVQPSLPGLGVQAKTPRPRTAKRQALASTDAGLVEEFRQRVRARFSAATARQYTWVLRDLLRIASTLAGRRVSVQEFFADSHLLGQTLASGQASGGHRAISAWLASQRRSVSRSFALLMANEFGELGIADPEATVTAALRAVAEPVGCGYRLPVGWPRGRGGPMPTPKEADLILAAMSSEPGWVGTRNAAFVSILAERGQRIGALLKLDGANLHRLPTGQVRALLHAKSSREPFELLIPAEAAEALDAYIGAFNSWARKSGLANRIGFGVPGSFWRALNGKAWSYREWSLALAKACERAGVPRYTAHGFRRAFATRITATVPRSVAALAGNWSSPRRMDDHYVQPSLTRLRNRLSRLTAEPPPRLETTEPVLVGVT
jgi:integrase